jgi:glycosyltransferase involved in cell wall biosynthesis
LTIPADNKAAQPQLRIAHVITRLLNGGADENTVLSCNHAAREGHEVTLVHGADTHVEILAKVDPRVRVVALPSLVQPVRPGSDVRALRELVRLFRRLRPFVVHTHTSKAGILGRIAARIVGTPVIVHGVHIVPFWNVGRPEALAYKGMERVVAQTTDAFIDVSSGVCELCLEAGVGRTEQHHVIPSGFELRRFRSAHPPEDWRDLLALRPDQAQPPVLVVVAAFEPRKRHLELLDEFPRIVERSPDVRLVLAGDGRLRPEIERRIETLGLGPNVVLTGFHPRPEQLIALADLCVLPSMREGLPRVIMQYLAGGKPVIASDLPGLDDVVTDEVNGIIAPSDDLSALADAVIGLLEDEGRRARLTRGAEAADLSEWDADRMGERVEAVYRDIIAVQRLNSTR